MAQILPNLRSRESPTQVLSGQYHYTAMTQSIIVFDQLVAAWIVKTVAVY